MEQRQHLMQPHFEPELVAFDTTASHSGKEFVAFLIDHDINLGFLGGQEEEIAGAAVVSDMYATDQPLVYINQPFCQLSGYSEEEILGKNCRFLQGPPELSKTLPEDVQKIRDIIAAKQEGVVSLLNYKKSLDGQTLGESFENVFLLMPLYTNKQDPATESPRFYAGFQTCPFIAESAATTAWADVVSKRPEIELPSNVRVSSEEDSTMLKKPNGSPLLLHTDFFHGTMVLQTKTPDTLGYFTKTKSKFMLTVKGVFSLGLPTPLWFGIEVEHPLPKSDMMRAAIFRIIAHVTKSIAKGPVHVNWTHSTKDNVRPCIATTVDHSKVSTTESCLKEYEYSFQSAYLHFERWMLQSLPAIRKKKLTYLLGQQPLKLVMYTTTECKDGNPHALDKRRLLASVTVTHATANGDGIPH